MSSDDNLQSDEVPLLTTGSDYLEDHHTYHRYGGRQKIREVEPDPKGRFCGGLVVLPRLRQKFIKDEETGEYVLAREQEERKATWLELFYDLIFVALVAQLTHALAENPVTSIKFSVLYLIIWRTWHGTTMYSTRYDTADLIHKWFYYFQMIAIVGMGINLHAAYTQTFSVGFGGAVLAARGCHLFMWTLAHFSESSSVTLHTLISIPVFSIPTIVCCFRPDLAYILWPIGAYGEEIFSSLRTMIVARCAPSLTVPISIEHLTERNGLFVMIVLGECVAGSMFRKSAVGEVVGAQFYVGSACGLLIAFSIAWIYFDTEGRPKKTHALRRSIYLGILWGFTHVPLVGFVMVGSAGLLNCMEYVGELETPQNTATAPTASHHTMLSSDSGAPTSHHEEHHLSNESKWLVSVGFGAATLMASFLGLLSTEFSLRIRRRWTITLRIILSIVTILIPAFSTLDAVPFLAVISTLTFLGALLSLVGGMHLPKPRGLDTHQKPKDFDRQETEK